MNLFVPRNLSFDDYFDRIKFSLIWKLLLILFMVFGALSVLFSFDGRNAVFTYMIADILSGVSLLYLYFTKQYKIVFYILAYIGTLIIHLDLNLTLDTLFVGNFLWMNVMILLAFFGLGKRHGLITISINTIASLYFFFFTMNESLWAIQSLDQLNIIVIVIEWCSTMFITGYLIFLFINIQRFAEHELVGANQELEKNNLIIRKRDEEKTILVKEIHHRVKNNLQIIISLLRLQGNDIEHEETKMHFDEAINRVMVMSSIHQKLYQGKDITKFELDKYIEELAAELKVFFSGDFPIDINIETDTHEIDLKTVVPVGLLLNELLSNAFKYAFLQQNSGRIDILIEEIDDANFKIIFKDNGQWKEPLNGNTGFGLELIDILTEQLDGSKQLVISDKGTTYEFSLQKN